MKQSLLLTLVLAATLPACGMGIGQGGPRTYRTLAARIDAESPHAVAERIRAAQADVAILAGAGDGEWFAEVARLADRSLSGPAAMNGLSFAFLGPEQLGDTTVVLPVEGGGELTVHDALYRVDGHRYLDVIAVAIPAGVDLRAAVRAILAYVATDVMPVASVALVVLPPDSAAGDRLAGLLQPLFIGAAACLEGAGQTPPAPPALRLFYGPAARTGCQGGSYLDGDAVPIVARLVVRALRG
jgi:hypothetical protein